MEYAAKTNKNTTEVDDLLLKFIATNPGLNVEGIRTHSPDFSGSRGIRALPNVLVRLQEMGKIAYKDGGYYATSQL